MALEKYQKLKQQVSQLPAWANNPDWEVDLWEVDLEIAIIILSWSGHDYEEVKKVLSQSPRVREWKASLSQQDYSCRASQYVQSICKWALQLQQWRQEGGASRGKSLHCQAN